jgi:hypothetical protein
MEEELRFEDPPLSLDPAHAKIQSSLTQQRKNSLTSRFSSQTKPVAIPKSVPPQILTSSCAIMRNTSTLTTMQSKTEGLLSQNAHWLSELQEAPHQVFRGTSSLSKMQKSRPRAHLSVSNPESMAVRFQSSNYHQIALDF